MYRFPLVSMVKVKRARDYFFANGTVPSGLVPEHVVRSWQRSLDSGVPSGDEVSDIRFLSPQELEPRKEKSRDLLTHSLPVMENLYEQIIHTSSKVLLADASGVILHSIGDPDFLGRARKVALQPGGLWSEEVRGTNAIGTALMEQAPMVVHSAEHFMATNHFLTCSASPIFDPYGSIMGVLDVSGDTRGQQQHTMPLVRISAQQIENQMFTKGFERDLVLHFHVRPEFVGTLYEGIAVFSQDGRLLAANRAALLHLGIDRYQTAEESFSTLFSAPLSTVFDQPGQFAQPVRQLRTSSGVTVFCRAKSRLVQTVRSTPVPSPPVRHTMLEDLESGDPGMQKVIAKARKVLGHDISVLIEGESGTGKELFAQAMHYSGPRRSGPFVALNCAALPEGLIESELFGYQEGAFTGAKRKGYLGKIRQADGGTLFLDEIGDMPLQLQARLLRVLQERTVSPLGGSEAHRVDFALVCATNRKIRDEVAAARFREDLYYRINGLVITLPRLRDREDRLSLACKILEKLTASSRQVTLGKEVEEIFARHPWPGNIRQMHNVLRTAVVLVGDEREITMEHLPDDLLEQYQQCVDVVQSTPCAPPAGEASNLDDLEMQAIRKAVEECKGNVTTAARQLGISRSTLYRKWQKFSP